jgi:hypothetical protein
MSVNQPAGRGCVFKSKGAIPQNRLTKKSRTEERTRPRRPLLPGNQGAAVLLVLRSRSDVKVAPTAERPVLGSGGRARDRRISERQTTMHEANTIASEIGEESHGKREEQAKRAECHGWHLRCHGWGGDTPAAEFAGERRYNHRLNPPGQWCHRCHGAISTIAPAQAYARSPARPLACLTFRSAPVTPMTPSGFAGVTPATLRKRVTPRPVTPNDTRDTPGVVA